MDQIKLLLPANPKYISTLRLTTASACNALDFSIEDIEDVSVAISEAFNMLVGVDKILFEYQIEDSKLSVRVSVPNSTIVYKTDIASNLGRQVLSSLVDDVLYEETQISFSKEKTE